MIEQLITVVILAGGRARRMGKRDKGLMTLNDKPLIKHVIDMMLPQNRNIVINANRNIEQYQTFGFPVIEDQWPEFQGPLAGMASAMREIKTPWVLTLPCDAPLVTSKYQDIMWSNLKAQQTDLIVAHDGLRLQSIHTLLSISLLDDLTQFLEGKERRLSTWFSRHALGIADLSQHAYMFNNLNSSDDLIGFQNNQNTSAR